MKNFDIIFCGGGIIGSALAYGVARTGASVLVLDEGDNAFRAARGNFGLVWYTAKGLGFQPYSDLTRRSVDAYPALSRHLMEDTGIDIGLVQTGGIEVCLNETEAGERKSEIETMKSQSPDGKYPARFIDPIEANEILDGMKLGPSVVGAVYCPFDGHVNPLKLFRGFHAGFQKHGGKYLANSAVREIMPIQGGFVVKTARDSFSCKRVVITAGLGIPELAMQVGLNIPVYPKRGQILVTERTKPILPLTVLTVRQTDEGSILLGDSSEDAGYNAGTTGAVSANIARRAVTTFPVLGNLNLVRTWGALRVLTPDHVPVYDNSTRFPGAFAATSHSGVTLAAANAEYAADWLLEDRMPDILQSFKSDRFQDEASART